MEPFDLRTWEGFSLAGGDLSTPAIIDHITIDSRRVYTPATLFVALAGSRTDGHRFVTHAAESGAKYAIVDKKYPSEHPQKNLSLLKVSNPLEAFQAIAGAYRSQFTCVVVGVTGSYGKTMVKDLLLDILRLTHQVVGSPESFNSQIGVPLSLLKIRKEHQIAVIEAGISKIGEMKKLRHMIAPQHVILTHVGRKHLEGLVSLENTAAEMMQLMSVNTPVDWTLMPETPELKPHLNALKSTQYFWDSPLQFLPHAIKNPNDPKQEEYVLEFPNGNRFQGVIRTGHTYFLDLINITIKAAWLLGATQESIEHVLTQYHPEPIRTEMWQNPPGGTIINEQYSSDPQSIDIALQHFDRAHPKGKKYFIFGGLRSAGSDQPKDYERIGQAIARAKVDQVHLVGNHCYQSLVNTLLTDSHKPEIHFSELYDSAFDQVKSEIKPNDTLLIKGAYKNSIDTVTKAFQGSINTNQCFINLAAIGTNLKLLKKKAGPLTKIMPIVKASAYGTDNRILAKFFESQGIDILGVSYVDEGILLINAGVKQKIFTLNAAPYEANKAVECGIEVGVSDLTMIRSLAEEARKQKKIAKVHLHVDTGMSRLGCRKEEAVDLALEIAATPFLKLEGLMTHFASAENPDQDGFTLMQIQHFDHVIAEIEKKGILIPWRHAANSSGLLRFHLPQYNMTRIGIALYGLTSSQTLELKLALSLQSRIVGINHCRKGETVSYGRNYLIERDHQKIAVVPIGYFDGLHRHYSGKGNVMIHGHKAPMVGNICMDYLMIDISDVPKTSLGDPVLIFGEDEHGNFLSPQDLALAGNSIAHELISCLGPRIQRVFIYEETAQSC